MHVSKYLRLLRWHAIHRGPRRDVTIETENGLLACDSADWLIGKLLYVHRSYEVAYMKQAVRLLRGEGLLGPGANELLLDVGANIGMICIPMVEWGLFRRAVAFEPFAENFRLLRKNVERNGLADAITPLPYALSSEEGETELELSPDNSGDHRIRRTGERGFYREERRSTVRIETRTLDGLYASMGGELGAPSLVWLDIQGHEGYFFRGARETLGAGVPVVSEVWPYGIARSGMAASEFLAIAAGLFTHFFVLRGEQTDRVAIGGLSEFFDRDAGPRRVEELIFVRERS